MKRIRVYVKGVPWVDCCETAFALGGQAVGHESSRAADETESMTRLAEKINHARLLPMGGPPTSSYQAVLMASMAAWSSFGRCVDLRTADCFICLPTADHFQM